MRNRKILIQKAEKSFNQYILMMKEFFKCQSENDSEQFQKSSIYINSQIENKPNMGEIRQRYIKKAEQLKRQEQQEKQLLRRTVVLENKQDEIQFQQRYLNLQKLQKQQYQAQRDRQQSLLKVKSRKEELKKNYLKKKQEITYFANLHLQEQQRIINQQFIQVSKVGKRTEEEYQQRLRAIKLQSQKEHQALILLKNKNSRMKQFSLEQQRSNFMNRRHESSR